MLLTRVDEAQPPMAVSLGDRFPQDGVYYFVLMLSEFHGQIMNLRSVLQTPTGMGTTVIGVHAAL